MATSPSTCIRDGSNPVYKFVRSLSSCNNGDKSSNNSEGGAIHLALTTIQEVYAPPEIKKCLHRAIDCCDIVLVRKLSDSGVVTPVELMMGCIRRDNVHLLESSTNLTAMLETVGLGTMDQIPPCVPWLGGTQGWGPLHLAAWEGSHKVLTVLLGAGAHVDVREGRGCSPLYICVKSGKEGTLQCMQVLLDHGADIEAKNKRGITPLLRAALDGKIQHVQLLIQRKAHLDVSTPTGQTAIEIIAKNVPSAVDDFKDRLDSGIIINPDHNEVVHLDFRKVFTTTWNTRHGSGDMKIFKALINSPPFKNTIEHPLLWAFLNLKLIQVKSFYYFTLLSHLIYSLVLSIYCGLLFNKLCPPGPEDVDARWNVTSQICCTLCDDDQNWIHEKAMVVLILSRMSLTVFIPIYIGREIGKLTTNITEYLRSPDAYRNLIIIILSLWVTMAPSTNPPEYTQMRITRITYYSASLVTFFIWLEMMYMVGRVPRFGKYVHMFRSVSMEIARFMVAYIFLLIGFMMSFIIIFSDQEPFKKFPAMFVKVLVMMTGEFEYENIKYPRNARIKATEMYQSEDKDKFYLNATEIEEILELNQFPIIAHASILLFVLMVSIVMMSLLVGLAVQDISALSKTGQRDQLIDQVRLINYVEQSFSSRLFRCIHNKMKTMLESMLLNLGSGFNMCPQINLLDGDFSVHPKSLKRALAERGRKIKESKVLDSMQEEIKGLGRNLASVKEDLEDIKENVKHILCYIQNKTQ